ncbi:MAG TPA: hypothetical protein VGI39_16890 [Polyangiaceae bacterium]|jgi:hypothetical protein
MTVPFVDATPDGLACAIEGLRTKLRAHLPAGEVAHVDLVLEAAQEAARNGLSAGEAEALRSALAAQSLAVLPSLAQRLTRIAAAGKGGLRA